ncbi:hypothetical protein C8T65DRAFT_720824 [Cerioporus squamosus]|nr:hypothetical protein C8T65DRAFT_720824 [Cerioporus squamosus]
MTEEAAHIAREAKALQQTLKESLKTKDPWDKETDFTRKQLRRNCLRLLLLHPYAPESKDAENQLWMQTSYAFIAMYKQRITQLDRAIHSAPRQNQQQQQAQGHGQGQGQQQGRGHGGHGAVEYRKLLQRFRQFLADEEKFWIQLIVRIRRIFQLDDAQGVLSDLGIVPEEPPAAAENGPPRRNHFQFPSDADVVAAAPSLTPSTREQRDSRMAILSKALVCLGDIERYKEQYNEAGGRPRAGHEDGPPAAGANGNQKGRGKKGGANGPQPPVIPRMRNYDKAQQCYQQARILLPQDGNPAHQMAILASYQKDVFNSLVHYYRALCVRSPYDTAAENLGTVLSKTFDQWKARGAKRDKEREKEQARGDVAPMAPRLRVEAFKEKLIVLHALWRIPREEADAISPNLAQKLADDFKSLVTERVLPLDIILKTIVLAQGALWKHRMFRTAPANGHKKGPHPAVSTAIENSIVGHLLLMHRVLLEVGIAQIAEGAPEDNGEADLAQRITAAFRRTLPALRIASKWLRANLRYLTQSSQVAGEPDTTAKAKGRDRRRGGERRSSSMSLTLSLPKLATALEEDVEMAGFLPLKKFVPNEVVSVSAATPNKDGVKGVPNGASTPAYQTLLPDQVHPNEEQLMRIDDLLGDAEALARDELSPLTFSDGRFSVKGFPNTPENKHRVPVAPPQKRIDHHLRQPVVPRMPPTLPTHIPHQPHGLETDDDNMTDITRTEDDPVDRAFREVLGAAEEEDEEDEIVWNPGTVPRLRDSAIIAAIPAAMPVSPPRHDVASPPVVSPPLISPRSPPSLSPKAEPPRGVGAVPGAVAAPTSTLTTAQDILANVLHPSPPKGNLARTLHMRQASAPQPHMLFGSNPLGAAGTTSGPLYQSSSYQSQNQLQSSQPSTFPLQPALALGHPSVALGPAHQYNSSPLPSGHGHQRIHSLSVTRSQLPSSQTQSQMSDPFGSFPALTEQAPIPYHSGVPGAYADPVYSRKLDPSYVRQEAPGMHDRSIPYHLDRGVGHGNGFPPSLSSMAQLWNNAG